MRDDDYGGPIDNRLRFMREVVDAVAIEAGIARTGIRLSPIGESQGANDSDNAALFTAAAAALEALGVPWIELREPGPHSTFRAADEPAVSPAMRQAYSGRIVLNSDYVGASAEARLAEESPTRSASAGRSSPIPTLSPASAAARRSNEADAGDLLQPRPRRLHRLSRDDGTGSRLTGSSPEQ